MTTIAKTTQKPISAASRAWPVVSAKIEPNRVREATVPLPPWTPRLKRSRKKTPRPSTQTKTMPIITSSAAARWPIAARSAATKTVAAKRPMRRSMPAAAAARAPVKATWLSASPANTWRAEHDEVADRAAGERDRCACEQGVADELVRKHSRSTSPRSRLSCAAPARAAAGRLRGRRGRRRRGRRRSSRRRSRPSNCRSRRASARSR